MQDKTLPRAEDKTRHKGAMGRRPFLAVGAAALTVASQGRAFADDSWPTKPITIVVSTKPGGGYDLMARTLAPRLSKKLGVPVVVADRNGGAMLMGTEYFLQQPHDGNTLLISGPAPYWYVDINEFHAPFKLEDFEILNVQWTDRSAIFVPKQGKYKSVKDIIDALKANEGSITGAAVRDSGEFYNLGIFRESLKIQPTAMRLVIYEASSDVRTALAGNQVDFAIVSLESSASMFGLMEPLAVFSTQRIPQLPDLPTVTEALQPYGIQVDSVPSSLRSVVVPSDLKTKYPDRYEKLLTTYQSVVQDPDFIAEAKKLTIGYDWVGPEASKTAVAETFTTLDKYKYLLNRQG